MLNNLVKLTYKLCSIPSISNDEYEILSYLSSWLTDQGFIVEKIPMDNARYNIFAYYKYSAQYSAIFCTHIDTVAPFFSPTLDEKAGIIFGRGSCDAKGIAAAMIHAVRAQYELGFDDLALLFTVGEEEASDGAKACVPHLRARARYVIVGEPTELRAAYGQKGCLVFDLHATGQEAHSSEPELGESAIHKLIHNMHQIMALSWPKDPQFGEVLLNFGTISGGSMRNVLAKDAHAKAIVRSSINNDVVIDKITSTLSPGVFMQILSSQNPRAFFTPEGFLTFLACFGSDAPYLQEVGEPMLIGPGSLKHAHKPDEHILYADLLLGVDAYQRIACGMRVK